MIGTRRRPEERRIQHWRLDHLTPHPLNAKLYGDARPSKELLDSIREYGILEPLIVTQRGQIISGHSRWQAAKIICAEQGKSEKTAYLMTMRPDHSPNDAWYEDEARSKWEDDNPLSLELLVIEANRQREKTSEQKAREFEELKRIEAALAKERQGTRTDIQAILPESSTGQARDKAAAAVGLGARTAEKLVAVVRQADGGDAKARSALDAVNAGEMSVSRAYKTVIKPNDPEKIDAGDAAAKELSKLFTNGEVTRSKKDGLFHVMIRDLSSDQVKQLAKAAEPEPAAALAPAPSNGNESKPDGMHDPAHIAMPGKPGEYEAEEAVLVRLAELRAEEEAA